MRLSRIFRKSFSTQNKGIPEIFSNPTFYVENQENCLNKTGIDTFNFEFNGKTINVYGLPTQLETLDLQTQYMKDISEIAISIDKSAQVLVQADPTFHMYEKRQVVGQIKKHVKYSGKDFDKIPMNSNPTIPINLQELEVEPYLLEISKAKEQDIQQIYEIIAKKDVTQMMEFQGYFSKYFSGKNSDDLESEEGQNMYREFCEQVQKQVIRNPENSQNDLVTLVVLNILKGNQIYLGDVPSLYFRIMIEDKLELSYLEHIYKQILTFMKDTGSQEIEGLYQMLMGQIFQQPIDFYLYYLIQQLALVPETEYNVKMQDPESSDKNQISCFVNNNHIEPLRIISKFYGDDGFQKDQNFSQFMQLKKDGGSQNILDEEKIKKHALLDAIFGTKIWEEEYVKNPFPYISEDYPSLSQSDQISIQKLFFTNQKKYQLVKEKMLQ